MIKSNLVRKNLYQLLAFRLHPIPEESQRKNSKTPGDSKLTQRHGAKLFLVGGGDDQTVGNLKSLKRLPSDLTYSRCNSGTEPMCYWPRLMLEGGVC